MDLQKMSVAAATDIFEKALNSTVVTNFLARLNTTTTDATLLATGVTAAVGLIMTRNFAMTTVKYTAAVLISILAYFISDIVLTRILAFVKIFLCALAALFVFLSAKTLIQEYL